MTLRGQYIDEETIYKRFNTNEDVARGSENWLPSSRVSFDLICETMQISHHLGTAPFSSYMHSRNCPSTVTPAETLQWGSRKAFLYIPPALFT